MPDKKEARQAGKHGRATYCYRQYTGIIPRRDFERGCWALGAMIAAFMALALVWEVIM